MKLEIAKYVTVFIIVALLGWAFYSERNSPSRKYKPRIRQQQAYKMIKEIHEHLGLGE